MLYVGGMVSSNSLYYRSYYDGKIFKILQEHAEHYDVTWLIFPPTFFAVHAPTPQATNDRQFTSKCLV